VNLAERVEVLDWRIEDHRKGRGGRRGEGEEGRRGGCIRGGGGDTLCCYRILKFNIG
jgi:hypothetical protein